MPSQLSSIIALAPISGRDRAIANSLSPRERPTRVLDASGEGARIQLDAIALARPTTLVSSDDLSRFAAGDQVASRGSGN
jgi:hypothetical protein